MRRLYGLDALRGVAALIVLWFHLHLSHRIAFYPDRGYIAVDFFFMLSGYVMARTYEGRIKGGLWFVGKRLRRLWPTVTIGSLIGLAVFHGSASVAVLNLFLIPVLWTVAAFPLNTPIWSIFFELFANALHGFWLHRVRSLLLGVIAGSAGLVALAMAMRFNSYSMGSVNFLGGFPRVIFAYVVGVILWRWWRDRPTVRLHPALLIPFGVFLFTPRGPATDFLFVALACPAIIGIGLGMEPRWGSLVGRLSFPLYAVHRPLLTIAASVGAGWFTAASASLVVAAVLTLTFSSAPGGDLKSFGRLRLNP